MPSESGLDTALGTLASAATPVKVERGTTIGRYVVIARLGAGAMGTVFAAFDPELDRKVAIKLLHPRSDEDANALRREAQTLARLSHPNVVGVHDVGGFGDRLFLAMEFIDGTTLRAWCESSPRTTAEIVGALVEAGRGLAAAHSAGIVHCDFKPDNVLVRVQGARAERVCVADFGVAAHEEVDSGDSEGSAHHRRVGTPAYMAPEQVLGEPLDHRADQYAFCIVAFEALAGARPFPDGDALTRATVSRPDLRRDTPRAVPARILRVLARGLEREPARRWPDMDALLSALLAASQGRRRTAALVGGAVLLAASGFAAARWTTVDPQMCDTTGALAETWDADARERVRLAFEGSGASFASVAFEHAANALDGWSRAWIDERRDACEATRIRGEQSERQLELRMACLDRQRDRVGAMAEVLALGGRDVVEGASSVIESAPDPIACRDVTRLDRGPALPDDPAVAREVEAVERELARVQALRRAGLVDQMLPLARTTLERAQATDYAPTIASATLAVADGAYEQAQYEAAERSNREGFELALAAGADLVALEGATSQIAILRQLQRFDEGQTWAGIAYALLRRTDAGTQMEATLEANVALIDMDAGRLDEAMQHAERTLELRRELPADDPRVGGAWLNVSAAYANAGREERALEAVQHAVAVFESSLGTEHPHTLAALNNAAIMGFNRGALDEAVALMKRVAEGRERALPQGHPDTIDSVANLAMMEFSAGHVEQAIARQERAYALAMGSPTPRIVEAARIQGNRAIMALRIGDADAAEDFARESVELFSRFGDTPQRGLAWLVRGEIAIERGRFADAREYTQNGLDDVRSVGEAHVLTLWGRLQIAELDAYAGQTESARALVDRALATLETADMPARSRAELLFSAAKALDGSDRARAVELARRALSTYGALADRIEQGRIEAWLAAH